MYEHQIKKDKKKRHMNPSQKSTSQLQGPIQRYIGFEFQFLDSKIQAVEGEEEPYPLNEAADMVIDGGISGECGNLEMITKGSINTRDEVARIVGEMSAVGSDFCRQGKEASKKEPKHFIYGAKNIFDIIELKGTSAQPQINTDMTVDKIIDTYPEVVGIALSQKLFSAKRFNWRKQQGEKVIQDTINVIEQLKNWFNPLNITLLQTTLKAFNANEQKFTENLPLFKGWATCVVTQMFQDLKIPVNSPNALRSLFKDIPILLKTSPDELLQEFAERVGADYRKEGFKGACFEFIKQFFKEIINVDNIQLQELFSYTEDDIYYKDVEYEDSVDRQPNHDEIRDYRYHHYDLAYYNNPLDDKHIPLAASSQGDILKVVMELRRCPLKEPYEWTEFALNAFDLFRLAQ